MVSLDDPRLQLRHVDGEGTIATRADEVAGPELAVAQDAFDLRLGLMATRALVNGGTNWELWNGHDDLLLLHRIDCCV